MCSNSEVGALWCILWLRCWQLWMRTGGCVSASVFTESLSLPTWDTETVQCCRWSIWWGLCNIHRSLLDFSPPSWNTLLFSLPRLFLADKAFFFSPLLYPEFMWASPGSLHPPLNFHWKMFNFIHYLLLCLGLQCCWPVLLLSPFLSLSHNPWSGLQAFAYAVPSTWEPSPVFIVWL